MEEKLPRLLLISEIPLCQEGTGINRTLFNLLENYPVEKFMLYRASSEDLTAPRFSQNIATFRESFLPHLANRLGYLINGAISKINLQFMNWLPISACHKIQTFAPEVILICPNSASALLMGYKVVKKFNNPFLIYFMDDWVATNDSGWLTGSVQIITRYLLSHASGWLMISDLLKTDLAKRYEVNPTRSLVVHNPVNLSERFLPDFSVYQGTFKVAYAGSIWAMHYDAIATVASTIYELQQTGHDIELVLYTDDSFWKQHRADWERWNVTFGGLIPYHQLGQYLSQADLLLVASSFLPENAHLTRSSVQTKLTDYMASGRPILSCGPAYSACNDFVKRWNCGFICESNERMAVRETLLHCMQKTMLGQMFAKNAYQVLQDQFEIEQVSHQLYQFILKTVNTTQRKFFP
jgi:glycosyltransferase involved in cell wall biosynthesis